MKGKNEKKRIALNNAGFSLIELIIASAITSVVSISVIAFVSIAMRLYNNTNSDVQVQMEASAASDFVTTKLREANFYAYKEFNNAGEKYSVLVTRGPLTVQTVTKEVEEGGVMVTKTETKNYYEVNLFVNYKGGAASKNSLLWNYLYLDEAWSEKNLSSIWNATEITSMINLMIGQAHQPDYFLARYVEDFKVTPASSLNYVIGEATIYDAVGVPTQNTRGVKVTISYTLSTKTLKQTYDVRMRSYNSEIAGK